MRILWVGTVALIMVMSIFCFAGFCIQSEIDRCVEKLQKRYESMQDFQAAFVQETHLSSIKRVEKGEGTVYFKKKAKMYWEYEKPTKQKIILDGQTLWFYIPEEKQVMKNNFSVLPSHIVADLFRGQINIQLKFKVIFIQQEIKDGKERIVLTLVPIIYDPTIAKLSLWIDPDTYLITRSSLEDEFGNKTILIFFNIKVDKGIDDSRFTFKPPPGVEIFEPPQL